MHVPPTVTSVSPLYPPGFDLPNDVLLWLGFEAVEGHSWAPRCGGCWVGHGWHPGYPMLLRAIVSIAALPV